MNITTYRDAPDDDGGMLLSDMARSKLAEHPTSHRWAVALEADDVKAIRLASSPDAEEIAIATARLTELFTWIDTSADDLMTGNRGYELIAKAVLGVEFADDESTDWLLFGLGRSEKT